MACWRRIPHFFDDSWGYHQENDDFKIKCLNFTKKNGEFEPARCIHSPVPLHGDSDRFLPLSIGFHWGLWYIWISGGLTNRNGDQALKNEGVNHQTYADLT
jgi:hypothetical protein